MRLIRPETIDDAALESTNVVEAAPPTYNGATTYALGAQVGVVTGTLVSVYTSLQAGNVGHAPATSPLWWRLSGSTYVEYSPGSTYAKGAVVIVAASHRRYESLQAANTGHPVTDADWWLDTGMTNRWRMFDSSVSTLTTNPDRIEIEIEAASRVDSIALLNVSAASATIVMTDPIEGEVYRRVVPLVSDSGIQAWWSYFFEPIQRLTDLIITDMPPYAGVTIQVLLEAEDQTVACGACIIGLSKEIGTTGMGATVGIQDYSIKSRNPFGDFTVVERSFSKRANFTILVDAGFVDELLRLLAGYRAIPIVYVGSEVYASTAIFGFYKDFQIEIAYPEHSLCSLEIEGLT